MRYMRNKTQIKKVWLIIAGALLCICGLFELLKKDAAMIERLFPNQAMAAIKSRIFSVFGAARFSVAEIFLYVMAIAALLCLIYFVVQLIKRRQKLIFAINFVVVVVVIVCFFQIFFTIFCGLDYYREPLAQKLGLEVKAQSKEVLILATNDILEKLNVASINVQRNEDGLFSPVSTQQQMFAYTNTAYQQYCEKNGQPYVSYSAPKAVSSSEIMNYLFISGFYFPFTGEANVNVKEGYLYLPLTACHEKAHQYGVMREDEANFLAYLVCTQSGNSDFVYSGYVKAFTSLSGQLYRVDKEAYRDIILKLNEKAIKDIQDYNDRTDAYEGAISAVSSNVNNTYLKAQGQSNGVKSYGKMADLLIAHYLNQNE